eukprot:scaffold72374_cov45-Prasinocladus_malaysianus.AAC.2
MFIYISVIVAGALQCQAALSSVAPGTELAPADYDQNSSPRGLLDWSSPSRGRRQLLASTRFPGLGYDDWSIYGLYGLYGAQWPANEGDDRSGEHGADDVVGGEQTMYGVYGLYGLREDDMLEGLQMVKDAENLVNPPGLSSSDFYGVYGVYGLQEDDPFTGLQLVTTTDALDVDSSSDDFYGVYGVYGLQEDGPFTGLQLLATTDALPELDLSTDDFYG